MISEIVFAKFFQEDHQNVTYLWLHISVSALDVHSHNMQFYPHVRNRQNVWNYSEAARVCTSSVQWLHINHCLLNYFLLRRPLERRKLPNGLFL